MFSYNQLLFPKTFAWLSLWFAASLSLCVVANDFPEGKALSERVGSGRRRMCWGVPSAWGGTPLPASTLQVSPKLSGSFVQAAELESSTSVTALAPMICVSCQRGNHGVYLSSAFVSRFPDSFFSCLSLCLSALFFLTRLDPLQCRLNFIFSLPRSLFSGFV